MPGNAARRCSRALGAPTTTPARIVVVDKPGSPQTQVRVASIGAARSTPDFRPMQVMNIALGGLFSSRINMNLREEHGYTYGASSQFSFRRAPGPFQVASGIRTDVTGPAISEIFKEVRGMVERPLTDDELKKAKDSLSNSLPGAFESSANAVNNFSNVFIYDLGLDYYSRYAEQVNAVTPEQTAGRGPEVPGSQRDGRCGRGGQGQDRAAAQEAESGRDRDPRYRRTACNRRLWSPVSGLQSCTAEQQTWNDWTGDPETEDSRLI